MKYKNIPIQFTLKHHNIIDSDDWTNFNEVLKRQTIKPAVHWLVYINNINEFVDIIVTDFWMIIMQSQSTEIIACYIYIYILRL